MRTKKLPSLKYLNECFELDSTCPSGLRWKVRPTNHFKPPFINRWNGRYAGTPAGNARANKGGKLYFQVGINNQNNLAHRIVYSLHNNIELSTEFIIDHEDGNSLNNSPDNLRLATHSQNSCNSSKRANNTSGAKGVFLIPLNNFGLVKLTLKINNITRNIQNQKKL